MTRTEEQRRRAARALCLGVILMLGGCSTSVPWGPYISPCSAESREIGLDESTALGFTARELGELGAAEVANVDVAWSARRIDIVPRTERLHLIRAELGPTAEEILHQQVGGSTEDCAAWDGLRVQARMYARSADSEVRGWLDGWISGGDLSAWHLSASGEVELDEARWAMVEARAPDHAAPPERITMAVSLGPQEYVQHVSISIDAPGYQATVWVCDTQRDPTCVTWSP